MLVLVALIVLLQPIWRPSPTLAGPDGLLTDAPVGLAAAMRDTASPADRAVVPQRWASWFEWAAPGVPVMVDSRIEVVPRIGLGGLPRDLGGWAGRPRDAGPHPGLARGRRIGAEQGALLRTLEAPGSGWRVVAEDGDGALFRVAPTGDRASGG